MLHATCSCDDFTAAPRSGRRSISVIIKREGNTVEDGIRRQRHRVEDVGIHRFQISDEISCTGLGGNIQT